MSWQKERKSFLIAIIIIGVTVFLEGVVVDNMFRRQIAELNKIVFDLGTVDIEMVSRFDKKIEEQDKIIEKLKNNDMYFKRNIEYQLILIQSLEKIHRLHEHYYNGKAFLDTETDR